MRCRSWWWCLGDCCSSRYPWLIVVCHPLCCSSYKFVEHKPNRIIWCRQCLKIHPRHCCCCCCRCVAAVALLSFHRERSILDTCNHQQINNTSCKFDMDNTKSERQTEVTLSPSGWWEVCWFAMSETNLRALRKACAKSAILFNALAMHGVHCKKWRHIASNISLNVGHLHQQPVQHWCILTSSF